MGAKQRGETARETERAAGEVMVMAELRACNELPALPREPGAAA
jgi:hypothetical protein